MKRGGWMLLLLWLSSCDTTWKGFEALPNGWHHRLDHLGRCEGNVGTADYILFQFEISRLADGKSSGQSQIFTGSLSPDSANRQSLSLSHLVSEMECGEGITIGLPWRELKNEWLGPYIDPETFEDDDVVRLSIGVEKVFTTDSYRAYLQSAAQQGEMDEVEAIELFLLGEEREVERHGKLYMVRNNRTEGDLIRDGVEVHIRYQTHLLSGVNLDSITEMIFPFGKPGQLIPGLQYGLSFLKEGESARILMPSFLAFGEHGSSTGIVPRNTPVFFDVELVRVGYEARSRK